MAESDAELYTMTQCHSGDTHKQNNFERGTLILYDVDVFFSVENKKKNSSFALAHLITMRMTEPQ